MLPFLYRCPNTGDNVQAWAADDPEDDDHVQLTACARAIWSTRRPASYWALMTNRYAGFYANTQRALKSYGSRWAFRHFFESRFLKSPGKGDPFVVTVPLAERGRARTLRGAGDRHAAYVVPCGHVRSQFTWLLGGEQNEGGD